MMSSLILGLLTTLNQLGGRVGVGCMCGDMEKMENEGIFCPLKDIPAFPWND
jgi:hypothetical protein